MSVAGSIILLAVILLVLFATIFGSFDPNKTSFEEMNSAPSLKHFFGTDSLGRDLMARVVYGIKVSFAIGILATMVSVIIGVSWGAIAGYSGGKTDYFMMRVVDIIYSLPFMFFVIILIVLVGRNIYNLFIALGAVQWLTMSRIVRSEVLSIKKRDYVEAARSVGLGKFKIITKHIIPNLKGPVVSYSFLLIPSVIIEESFLSFLGLGVQAPNASLGTLISDGIPSIDVDWWILIIPTVFLVLVLFSLNLLGEGLKDPGQTAIGLKKGSACLKTQ